MNQYKKLDMQIVKELIGDIDYIDNDFIVLDDLSKFKIGNNSPVRIGAFTISLCLSGHISADINMLRYDIQPGDMVITLPKDIIEHKEVSDDIRGIFFIVSQNFIEEAFPKISEILPSNVSTSSNSMIFSTKD